MRAIWWSCSCARRSSWRTSTTETSCKLSASASRWTAARWSYCRTWPMATYDSTSWTPTSSVKLTVTRSSHLSKLYSSCHRILYRMAQKTGYWPPRVKQTITYGSVATHLGMMGSFMTTLLQIYCRIFIVKRILKISRQLAQTQAKI